MKTNKLTNRHHRSSRGYSMMVAVGMMGIVTMALLASSAIFIHQAKRTRTIQQQAQERQLEIAKVLLADQAMEIQLPKN